jgi:hypothetical protein
MTDQAQTSNRGPVAIFVVEREAGKGYRVTSAHGPRADELKVRALALLDRLGQPDPTGPEEIYNWLGPIAPTGEYVGVTVRLTTTGEARYHQAWFDLPSPDRRAGAGILLPVVLALIIGLVAGAFIDHTWLASVTGSKPAQPAASEADPRLVQLGSHLAASREVRDKLFEYFAQDGFAADPAAQIVDEKRAIKLIADLDKTPPSRETIRLNNIEVRKLLDLLHALDEWYRGSSVTMDKQGPR